VDFRSMDYCQPTAIVLGNEKEGLTDDLRSHADGLIHIPMQGMVESLNVSVACALILFEAQRQRLDDGFYADQRLDPKRHADTLFEWLHPKVARFCRERNLAYPKLNDQGDIVEAIPGTSACPMTN